MNTSQINTNEFSISLKERPEASLSLLVHFFADCFAVFIQNHV